MNVSPSPLELFKALADANRLKIVGLLAQEPRSVEELALLAGLPASTTSHHLKRLAEAGLVAARAEGHASVYSLRTDVLQDAARRLLREDDLRGFADGAELSAFDRKVLQTFTDAEGRIRRFPSQRKKYLVLLRHVADAFEAGRRYSEREVNDLLTTFNDDTARLRRGLVDFGFMEREGGGGDYWRAEP